MSTTQPAAPAPEAPTEPTKKRRPLGFLPRWRKATWAIAIWTVLMAAWIIGGASSASNDDCAKEVGDEYISTESVQSLCDAATDVGTGIGIAVLLFLWFVGFIVLSLVWLMSRPRQVEVRIVK